MDSSNIIVKRAADLISKSRQIGKAVFTNFLDPSEQLAVQTVCLERDTALVMWGGFGDAERKIAAFHPSVDEIENDEFPISAVMLSLPEGNGLIHRDYLGSLMALGIKREQLGDIVINPSGAAVFCGGAIAKYIEQNLTKVGNINVSVMVASPQDVEVAPREMKEVRGTVASARLDAILALVAKKSRSQAAVEIEGGLVNVNFKQVTDPSRRMKAGDIVSCRGFGRFEYVGDGGLTKKGRLSVNIKIYV